MEFFEEIFILFLGAAIFLFVFHFEHDRDKLGVVVVGFFIDVITFCTARGIVVFLEVDIFVEGCRAQLIEFDFAVLLEGFAEHFGREPCLEVAEALNGFVFEAQLVVFALDL